MLKSTAENYGRVAVLLHWVIAVFLSIALASGFALESADNKAYLILTIHLIAGAGTAFLTLIRLLWWLFLDTAPKPASQNFSSLAKTVRILFYLVPIGMAITGMAMIVFSSALQSVFADIPHTLPNFDRFIQRVPHGMGARFLMILIAFHLTGILYHRFKRRHNILNRMTWRR